MASHHCTVSAARNTEGPSANPNRLAHLTGYNMQWASTIKEVELSHFFKEWPAMWKRFWDIWIVSWVIMIGVAIMASNIVPAGYRM